MKLSEYLVQLFEELDKKGVKDIDYFRPIIVEARKDEMKMAGMYKNMQELEANLQEKEEHIRQLKRQILYLWFN